MLNISKYGKPVWQYVLEAARELKLKTFAPIDIIKKVHEKNPRIPAVTIRSYVTAMAPNHPSSKHYPSTRRLHPFFKYLGDGRFQLSERATISPRAREEEIEEAVEEVGALEEATISLERDLEQFIFGNLGLIEEGLKPYKGEAGRQYSVKSGRIDILAQDKEDEFVVIELKAGTATDRVLTQILAYMADVKCEIAEAMEGGIRGIIVAYSFSDRLVSAASLVPGLRLIKYKVSFEFEEIG